MVKKQLTKRRPKTLRKSKKPVKKSSKKAIQTSKPSPKLSNIPASLIKTKAIILAGESTSIIGTPETRPAFDITLSDIDGDTTIGDLLVVFPRTRDVLFKHGVSFDVEEAGYVYMTLNVFSALHGVKINNLIDELVIASKEVLTQPQQPPQASKPLSVTTPAV